MNNKNSLDIMILIAGWLQSYSFQQNHIYRFSNYSIPTIDLLTLKKLIGYEKINRNHVIQKFV